MMNAIHGQPQPILVRKLDPQGTETWRYSGHVLSRDEHSIKLEARFNRQDLPFHGLILAQNDRFIETFYSDRWYNIFEIHDRDTDVIKCWYCNVGYPAEILEEEVSYRDLALDLLVFPDGRQLILDEEEFQSIPLSAADQNQARLALQDLQAYFRTLFEKQRPFTFPQ